MGLTSNSDAYWIWVHQMMSIDSATDFTLLSCFCFCDFLYRSSINCLLFGFIGFNLLLKISHPLFEYKRTHTSTPLFNKQYSKITWAKWYQNVVKSFWYGLNAARDNGGGSGANWNSNMHKAPVQSPPPEYQDSSLQAPCPPSPPTPQSTVSKH